jgi:DNA-binding NarL/FixJ family response regulator
MPEHTEKRSVMIVDDDPLFLKSIYRLLHSSFLIIALDNPLDAISQFTAKGPFDVVVSDYRMPKMDGIELLCQLRQLNPQTKRIILTGYAELNVAIQAVNLGKVSGFLTKPIPVQYLKSFIENLLCENPSDNISPPSLLKSYVPSAQGDPNLTRREIEVMNLVEKGFSNAEISKFLNITIGTVKSHLNNIFYKLNVTSRAKLIAMQHK